MHDDAKAAALERAGHLIKQAYGRSAEHQNWPAVEKIELVTSVLIEVLAEELEGSLGFLFRSAPEYITAKQIGQRLNYPFGVYRDSAHQCWVACYGLPGDLALKQCIGATPEEAVSALLKAVTCPEPGQPLR